MSRKTVCMINQVPSLIECPKIILKEFFLFVSKKDTDKELNKEPVFFYLSHIGQDERQWKETDLLGWHGDMGILSTLCSVTVI
ncbi:hypothetical protein ACQKIW_28305 [Bacillus thuringiensis]|uniref:hypothetical protein n=1 Tax=Bacillus thuringiensis TaxID=1428 RepID=UPI003D084C9F